MSSGEGINRPLANFSPSIWGDYFKAYASISTEIDNNPKVVETITELKNQVKKMFDTNRAGAVQNTRKMLDLLDSVQRLGVACHFEEEIETTVQKMHNNILYDQVNNIDADLYTIALCFRLLRQHGYNISCEIFKKFMYKEGKFKESIVDDIQGMLSLYEASHLRGHGEEILDEALIFTTTHLRSVASSLSSPLTDQVKHALKCPIQYGIERGEGRRYLSVYEQDDSHSEALLTLAKLEFNQLQLLYKKELSELTRWRMDLDRAKLLSFSRDRIVECFFWSMGLFSDAKHSLSRKMFAKQISILCIIDDIYDSFGTLDELELFTEALQRWDISAIDKLPEYMKLSYKATLDFYVEVEEMLAKERSYSSALYWKEAFLKQVRAYFQEAKWMYKKEIPTLEEYLPTGYDSSGTSALIVLAFIGMKDHEVTKDYLDWVLRDPKMVRATAVHGRVMNDICYNKIEQKRSGSNTVPTAVDCHMKQYGTTEEEAVCELTKLVVNAWKDVNEECLKPSIPRPFVIQVLQIVRTHDEMYRDRDRFTLNVLMKDMIASLIVDPVPL